MFFRDLMRFWVLMTEQCDRVNSVSYPTATLSLPSAVYDYLFIAVRPKVPQEPPQIILEVLFL